MKGMGMGYLALVAAAAACSSALLCGNARADTTKPPIKVGAVSSLGLFPEASAGARAYFDVVNADGGIHGRRLQLIVEDDKAQPELAAQVARKLVEHDNVVANVGSASVLDCAVNAAFYEEKSLVSIQGTGVDPACFATPNISPVNTGPYVGTAVALQFLSEIRSKSRVCVVTVAYALVQKPAFEKAIAGWSRLSGKQLAFSALGVSPDADLASLIKAVVNAQCQGVVFTAIEPTVINWVKTANRLGVRGIDWVFLTPAYTENVAATLKTEGEGIYAISEFEPWSSRSGMLTDWRNVMVRGKVPLTSLSQGGYVSASVFVSVLRSIKGEITRESVTAAFKGMDERKVPFMGTPYTFGGSREHNPNRAAIPVRLSAGRWEVAHWDYIVLPDSHK